MKTCFVCTVSKDDFEPFKSIEVSPLLTQLARVLCHVCVDDIVCVLPNYWFTPSSFFVRILHTAPSGANIGVSAVRNAKGA